MSAKKVNIFYLGGFLAVTCAVATALMGYVANVTKAPIQNAKAAGLEGNLKKVMSDFDNKPEKKTFKSADGFDVSFYTGTKAGKLSGIAGIASSLKGYGGKVEVMIGLDASGAVSTVIVTEQNETPGLGTNLTDRRREKTIFNLFAPEATGLPPNRILDQFNGHKVGDGDSWKTPWAVKKDGGDVDFVTGATVTSRAITDAVYRIMDTFAKNKDAITALKN